MAKKNKSLQSAEPNAPIDHQKILGLAVNTLGRNIVWSLSKRTARHGVLPGVYPIIAWLMQLPDSTQAELSRLVGIEQPTMAITLRRMERDGLIQRKPDPDHGQRSAVTLYAPDLEVTSPAVLFYAFHALSRCRSGSTAGAVGRYPKSTIRSEDRPQALQGIYRRTRARR